MRPTTYARSLHDLNLLRDQGFREVILEPKALSRFGKLSTDEYVALFNRASELGLRVLLEWDILMTEDVFEAKVEVLRELLPYADALRVQDPGALQWALTETRKPLQFIAENGNHNRAALEGWIDLAGGRLERIVLSIELAKAAIQDYVENLSVPCELLGFGRILLFYTPRPLLSALVPERIAQNAELAALGESEESPHKGFPIVENSHGTFMFHIKEFCLLDFAADLRDAGLGFFRIDQRWEAPPKVAEIAALFRSFDAAAFERFKAEYSQDLMRGFYLVNKTDVLFPKLKNSRLQQREGNYLGEVLEAEKASHLAIMVKNPRGLRATDQLRIIHPKGQVIEAKVYSLKNLALEDVTEAPAGSVGLVQFVGGVWVKSQVYFVDG
jgi:putative protease